MANQIKVYWYEIEPSEDITSHLGELGYAVQRIKFAVREMESGFKNVNDMESIFRLQYQVENYYVRTYELRERLCAFVAALTRNKSVKNTILNGNSEDKIELLFPDGIKSCVKPLMEVLNILNNDVKIRKVHTHNVFIKIGYNMNNRYTSLEEIFWDFEFDNVAMGHIGKQISKEANMFLQEYKDKVDAIETNVNMFLRCVHPYLLENGV